jgi:hypothetical protein
MLVAFATSCSKSLQEKLVGIYWFEPEDEEILIFNENGVVNELIYNEKGTYNLKGDSLQVNISGWGSDYYAIREINEEKLIIISNNDNVWELKPAIQGDFIIGEWEGKLFNKTMNLEFSEGQLTIENYDAEWDEDDIVYDDFYRVEENKIFASKELYSFTYELNEDKNEMKLIQGDNLYIFKRN